MAICDKSPEALNAQREAAAGLNITFYDHFDQFIQHDMDAVVLVEVVEESGLVYAYGENYCYMPAPTK